MKKLIKTVRFFCRECGIEIWDRMANKDTTTIKEAEDTAICTDCMLKEFRKANNK